MHSHALVYEYRQSLCWPRVQLCVREVVRCACDVTMGVGGWCTILAQQLCSVYTHSNEMHIVAALNVY